MNQGDFKLPNFILNVLGRNDALTINVEFVNSLKMYDLKPAELTRTTQ